MYPENPYSHNWLIKRALNQLIAKRLGDFSGLVVDLGCGKRPFEADIRRFAREYFGIDWANSLHDLQADIIADLNLPLPIREGVVDHVVSFEVLEHLAEPRVMLQEAFRILRPGGDITLSVPFQWWVHESPWDYSRFTNFGLIYLFARAGFDKIVVVPTTGFWSMWILKFNYQLVRIVRGRGLVRSLMICILVPIWWSLQKCASLLDRVWPEERESAGYFVTARKPE